MGKELFIIFELPTLMH